MSQPLYKPHDDFETLVRDELQSMGFFCPNAVTYHEAMQHEAIRLLQERYSGTSLYIRTRADRIAIHKSCQLEFEWEAKTIPSHQCNLAIEALPILHHMTKADLGVRCLYVCRNLKTRDEFGFWTDNPPSFSRVMIPTRWDDFTREWFTHIFEMFLPNVPIQTPRANRGRTRGSGDPFLIVNQDVVDTLPDWRGLVAEKIVVDPQKERPGNYPDRIDFT